MNTKEFINILIKRNTKNKNILYIPIYIYLFRNLFNPQVLARETMRKKKTLYLYLHVISVCLIKYYDCCFYSNFFKSMFQESILVKVSLFYFIV